MARIVKWAVRLAAIDAEGETLELSVLITNLRELDVPGDLLRALAI
ncbi:MAG: hypothetical protein ACLQFI_03940 [Methylocella sp.]